MSEQAVAFPSGDGARELEGRLLDGGGPPVVVSHPHPLHGGDMDHPVVAAIWRAAAEAGYKALRYNFRGVGASSGKLTPLSPLPLEDLQGAIRFLGGGPLRAIGYSYGARTTLHALHAGYGIERAVLIGLPTRLPADTRTMSNLILGRRISGERYRPTPDLDLLKSWSKPIRVIAGSLDPLFVAQEVRKRGVEPTLIDGVNHFFSRRLGNQTPEAEDLVALTELVLAFLR